MILGTMISLGSAHEIDLSGIGFGTGGGSALKGIYCIVCTSLRLCIVGCFLFECSL